MRINESTNLNKYIICWPSLLDEAVYPDLIYLAIHSSAVKWNKPSPFTLFTVSSWPSLSAFPLQISLRQFPSFASCCRTAWPTPPWRAAWEEMSLILWLSSRSPPLSDRGPCRCYHIGKTYSHLVKRPLLYVFLLSLSFPKWTFPCGPLFIAVYCGKQMPAWFQRPDSTIIGSSWTVRGWPHGRCVIHRGPA